MNTKTTRPHLLLAIPGGGVRGIVSAVYADRLVTSGHLKLNEVGAFSGTSAGSIIAAALACGFPTSEIVDLFADLAPRIFKPRCFLPRWLATAILGAPYSTDRLIGVLRDIFGDRKLGDVPSPLVVVAWNLSGKYVNRDAAAPLVFTNVPTGVKADEALLDLPLASVLGASCAAPGYFAPLLLKTKERKILAADGALVSNLSICANLMVSTSSHYNGHALPLEQTYALVLGNGARIAFDKAEPQGGWATPAMVSRLIGSIGGANQVFGHELASALLGSRYLNFDQVPDFDVELDEVSGVQKLNDWAKMVNLATLQQWLSNLQVDSAN